ncbi:hypothetical protein F5Y04DRAFT_278954 [Hypomontagnella monticulosa]|nr:hypothetical protein F5Y04DRAFT_278954 [Hypomontagnella monticulosa]
MSTTSNVFVTSATGTQGTALCYELLKVGWNVRSTIRDVDSLAARDLCAAGVHFTLGNWDDENALREGLRGCDKLYLCLYPDIKDLEHLGRQAAVVARLAKEAGINHAATSTSLAYAMLDDGLEKRVSFGPFFKGNSRSMKRLEQAVIDGNFATWTVLRPAFFMANLKFKISFWVLAAWIRRAHQAANEGSCIKR